MVDSLLQTLRKDENESEFLIILDLIRFVVW